MSILQNGKWQAKNALAETEGGKFKRPESDFRHWIGDERFPAESDRYHLYISHACPWSHRTTIFRALKGLEDIISLGVVRAHMGENGWEFGEEPDPLTGAHAMHEVYTKADANYTGRVTVPVLWDKKQQTIVNNESSDIIRMFNSAFAAFAPDAPDYYPQSLRAEIDAVNDMVYTHVNNGVYKCGFASTQEAYAEAFHALFGALDKLETLLGQQRYLVGNHITEADWRLFVTLVRFDAVYVGHFKCNRQRMGDYPHLSGYLRELYQLPGVSGTVHMDHIKTHYYTSHPHINPQGIVPLGPKLDFTAPHGREMIT